MKNTMLQFDFKREDQTEPIIFKNPNKLITAYKAEDLPACWEAIDQAIDAGFYVAGYVTYEVAYSLFDIQSKHDNETMPLLSFGVFDAPSRPEQDELQAYDVSEWIMTEEKTTYAKHFQEVIDAIQAAIIEQVNYTVNFTAKFTGDSYHYYNTLKNAQQASYAAYLKMDDKEILSVSPELFYEVKNDVIKVRPMKGTIARGKSYEEDQKNRTILQNSSKDQLENRIITNLMADELKQVASNDSIRVKKAYTVEKYPTVYQMTSTLVGDVLPNISMTQIFRRLFPCGSISGAPKKASLQVIHDIETKPRHIYCGAIGYFTPDHEAIFNVPIRTVTIDRNTNSATYGAGGAITAQSSMENEFNEVIAKTKVLSYETSPFDLLETFGLYDGEYLVFQEHLRRLKNSAKYFSFSYDEAAIKKQLADLQTKHPNGRHRVRLTLSQAGKITTKIAPLLNAKNNQVAFARTAINKDNHFLYHKTTNRRLYEVHQDKDIFDTLLWNESGQVTEFTIGNVVLEIDGILYTPPVSVGLLAGTFREMLLKNGVITEKVLYKEDFTKDRKMWLINSVRQWTEVFLKNK